MKKEIWGKCVSLPEDLKQKLLDYNNTPVGLLDKIIRQVYPQHNRPTGDKKFLVILNRQTQEIRTITESCELKILASNETDAREIANVIWMIRKKLINLIGNMKVVMMMTKKMNQKFFQ